QLLARRAGRARGQSALRRAGDDGDPDLRPADRLAELDLPAPQRGRRNRRAEALRHRSPPRFRPGAGVTPFLIRGHREAVSPEPMNTVRGRWAKSVFMGSRFRGDDDIEGTI